MKNPAKRREVLTNGDYKNYAKKRRDAYFNGFGDITMKPVEMVNPETAEVRQKWVVNADFFDMTQENADECERVREAQKRQRNRSRDHIGFMMKHYKDCTIFFATFTFTEQAMEMKRETRKAHILKALSKAVDYHLNIDYGKTTEREHYHAVIALKKGDFNAYDDGQGHLRIDLLDAYDYGFYNVKEVGVDDEDVEKLARYETKLAVHSAKEHPQYISTKRGSPYQKSKWPAKTEKRIQKPKHELPPNRPRIDFDRLPPETPYWRLEGYTSLEELKTANAIDKWMARERGRVLYAMKHDEGITLPPVIIPKVSPL